MIAVGEHFDVARVSIGGRMPAEVEPIHSDKGMIDREAAHRHYTLGLENNPVGVRGAALFRGNALIEIARVNYCRVTCRHGVSRFLDGDPGQGFATWIRVVTSRSHMEGGTVGLSGRPKQQAKENQGQAELNGKIPHIH